MVYGDAGLVRLCRDMSRNKVWLQLLYKSVKREGERI
jgi:hypothetical protein